MDARKALQPGTRLSFPAMECIIEEEFGRGSNAIVYKGWYSDHFSSGERHAVLIKELFPWHPKGLIYRDSEGHIVCAEGGQEVLDRHTRSFEYGNHIHLRLLNRYPDQTGTNLNTFSLHHTWYTVMGFSGGRSLEHEYADPASDLRVLAVRILGILDALSVFHKEGYLHLDVAPDNILLVGEGSRERVMLIDYNSVIPVRPELREATSFSVIKTGYSSPEIRTGNRAELCPASDLYSVTAVFFRSLTGKALSLSQMIRKNPPDITNCVSLTGMPDTVIAMVREILGRGLHVLPGKRYPNTEAMMDAIRELIDRIDGVGITHWSLWEAGRKKVRQTIRENPFYSYIEDEKMLFPARVICEDDTSVSAQEYYMKMYSPEGCSSILTAGAGMGKTTFLLRMLLLGQKQYSPTQSALIYLPLSENRRGSILDRILEILRFDRTTITYDNARHSLRQLLDTPLETTHGTCPVLVLLLDGWNEIPEGREELEREIRELAALRGLRVLISSRNKEPSFAFRTIQLSELSDREVQQELSSSGLLMPESEEVQRLLKVPLLLSIFIRSSLEQEKQLCVQNQEELLDTYFASILQKEIRNLPESSGQRWAVEAAMHLVLPAIAEEMEKRYRPLTDEEMMRVVQRCFRQISGRRFLKDFPQWTGRSREIRGGCSTADEWFGLMIHDILWKRMGLLVRTQSGEYQLQHQVIREYLAGIYERSSGRIRRTRRNRVLLCLAAAAVVALGILAFSGAFRLKTGKVTLTDAETILTDPAKERAFTEDEIAVPAEETAFVQEENALPPEKTELPADETVLPEEDFPRVWNSIYIDGAEIRYYDDHSHEIFGVLPEGVTVVNDEICLNDAMLHQGISADADTVTIRLTGENTLEGSLWFSNHPVICGEGSLTVTAKDQEGLFCAEGPVQIEDCRLTIQCNGFGIMIGVREGEPADPDLVVQNAKLHVSSESVCLYAGNILVEDSEIKLESSSEDPDFSGYNGQEAAARQIFVMRNSLLDLSHEYEGKIYTSFCGGASQVIFENSQIISQGYMTALDLQADHCSFTIEGGDREGSSALQLYDGDLHDCEIHVTNTTGSGVVADHQLTMERCTLDVKTWLEGIFAGNGDLSMNQCTLSVESSASAVAAGGNNRVLWTDCTGSVRGAIALNCSRDAQAIFTRGDLVMEGTQAAVLSGLSNPEEGPGIQLQDAKEESGIPLSSLIWNGMIYYTFGEDLQYDGETWIHAAQQVHIRGE